MADNVKKRNRKDVLLPRKCIEDFEVRKSDMQSESDAVMGILPKLKSDIDKEMSDAESKPPELSFSVDIEVEECMEVAESPPKSSQEIHDSSLYNQVMENLQQCVVITDKQIRLVQEAAMRNTTSIADKVIEIEIRNTWGREVQSLKHDELESLIQNGVDKWRSWNGQSKARGNIFVYKCNMCAKGWWHLHPFKEHLRSHMHDKKLKLCLENFMHECNMVAYNTQVLKLESNIEVEGNCWKCLRTYKEHLTMKRTHDYYCCRSCKSRAYTCISLTEHEGICQKYHKSFFKDIVRHETDWHCNICNMLWLTKERYNRHLADMHTVRNDLPMNIMLMKTCSVCEAPYWYYPYHDCPKKTMVLPCEYCCRRFHNKAFLKLHQKNTRSNTHCRICNEYLEKQCMELEHMLSHTTTYVLSHKCKYCKETIIFPDEEHIKRHMYSYHRKKYNPVSHTIIVPKCLFFDNINMREITVDDEDEDDMETEDVDDKQPTDDELEEKPDEDVEFIPSRSDIEILVIEDSNDAKDDDEFEEEIKKEKDDIDKLIKQSLYAKNSKATPAPVSVKTEVVDIKEVCKVIKEVEKDDSEIERDDQKRIEEEIKQEQEDLEAFSNVFKVSKNLRAVDVTKDFAALLHDELIIKEEPMEEDFEDDIIVWDSRNPPPLVPLKTKNELTEGDNKDVISINEDGNDDSTANDEGNSSRAEQSDTSLEPEVNITDGTVLLRRVYGCKKCPFRGPHKDYRYHKLLTCPNRRPFRPRDTSRQAALCPKLNAWPEYECTKCKKTYTNFTDYLQHFDKHNLVDGGCPQCGAIYDKIPPLIYHVTAHIKQSFMKMQLIQAPDSCITSKQDGLYQCRICAKNLMFDDFFKHWEKHLEIYVVPEVEQDKDEPNTTSSEYAINPVKMKEVLEMLTSPIKDLAGQGFSLKQCAVCNRKFDRRNDCKRHLIEHLLRDAMVVRKADGCLKCQICKLELLPKAARREMLAEKGRLHSTEAYLYKEHMRNHGSLPLYKCQICSKSFSDSSNFTKHKKVHNMKVLICGICNRKFQAKLSLIKHMEMHNTTPPTKCEDCKKTFYCPSDYRKHRLSAHGLRKAHFPCPSCPVRCDSLRQKWDHMWEVHKERKHAADCPFCDMEFRKFQDLKQHVASNHKVKLMRQYYVGDGSEGQNTVMASSASP